MSLLRDHLENNLKTLVFSLVYYWHVIKIVTFRYITILEHLRIQLCLLSVLEIFSTSTVIQNMLKRQLVCVQYFHLWLLNFREHGGVPIMIIFFVFTSALLILSNCNRDCNRDEEKTIWDRYILFEIWWRILTSW